MSGDIVQGNLGQVGKYDVSFTNKQLVIEADASVGASSMGAVMKVDAKQVLDALVAKVPGGIPQELAKMLEDAILA